MIGQSNSHSRGDWLPLLARAVTAFLRQASWQAPPQTAMRHDETIVGERQCELMLQVVWGSGEGIHLWALGAQLTKLNEPIYYLRWQKLEALVTETRLAQEATKRGLSVQALLDAEVTAKVALVTEQEIEGVYQATRPAARATKLPCASRAEPTSRTRSSQRSGTPSCSRSARRPTRKVPHGGMDSGWPCRVSHRRHQ
jgi:hypothetical protein